MISEHKPSLIDIVFHCIKKSGELLKRRRESNAEKGEKMRMRNGVGPSALNSSLFSLIARPLDSSDAADRLEWERI